MYGLGTVQITPFIYFFNAGKGFPSWNVSMTITGMPRPRFGLPEAGKDKIPQLHT